MTGAAPVAGSLSTSLEGVYPDGCIWMNKSLRVALGSVSETQGGNKMIGTDRSRSCVLCEEHVLAVTSRRNDHPDRCPLIPSLYTVICAAKGVVTTPLAAQITVICTLSPILIIAPMLTLLLAFLIRPPGTLCGGTLLHKGFYGLLALIPTPSPSQFLCGDLNQTMGY